MLLFVISLFVNIGMWSERVWIVDHVDGARFPSPQLGRVFPDVGRDRHSQRLHLPLVPGLSAAGQVLSRRRRSATSSWTSEEEQHDRREYAATSPHVKPARAADGGRGRLFRRPTDLLDAVEKMRDHAVPRPGHLHAGAARSARASAGRGKSPVRFWTLIGGLCGVVGGFAPAIGTALVNGLIVGGKHPVSIIPYCIAGFEGTDSAGRPGKPGRHAGPHAAAALEDAAGL